jgi:ribonuclease HI
MESLYTDGGVLRANPSPHGLTWAWVLVGKDDQIVREASGLMMTPQLGLPTASNNVAELFAMWHALESMAVGWQGVVYTDSLITLRRITAEKTKYNGVPDWLRKNIEQARQKNKWTVELLGGHPSRAELAAGVRKDGARVSKWNVHVDEECGRLAEKFFAELALQDVGQPSWGGTV